MIGEGEMNAYNFQAPIKWAAWPVQECKFPPGYVPVGTPREFECGGIANYHSPECRRLQRED